MQSPKLLKSESPAQLQIVRRRFNRYQDLELNAQDLPHDELGKFLSALSEEERRWLERLQKRTDSIEARIGALFWIKIPVTLAHLLPPLISTKVFTVHHACGEYIMLVKGPDGHLSESVPQYGTHYTRIECLVMDPSNNKVIIITERMGARDITTYKKFVTGSVDPGEYISDAARREILEETGIETKFIGILGIVNRLGTRFMRDEILVGCLLYCSYTNNPNPKPQSEEIKSVDWVDLKDILDGNFNIVCKKWITSMMQMHPAVLNVHTLEDFRGRGHFMNMYACV